MSAKSYLHSIYGGGAGFTGGNGGGGGSGAVTYVSPDTCCTDALIALSSLFSAMEQAINVFFPANAVVAPMIAPMGASATLSDKLFVRITWRQEYPGMIFNPDNLIQRLQIKDMYIRYGLDYTADPLFLDAIGVTLI
jgi:hypothetical protein